MIETIYSQAIVLCAFILDCQKKMTSFSSQPEQQPNKPMIHSNGNKTSVQNESIASQIMTIPNLITLSRIAIIPFILYFILNDQHINACLLFVYAAISDFLDGFIARKCATQSSFLGSILDPLADKLLIGSLAITLTINNMIPLGKQNNVNFESDFFNNIFTMKNLEINRI